MQKTFNRNKLFSLIFIVIGVAAIVFSILCFTDDGYFLRGSYEANETYGGDAYTGIQNAAAQAANNLLYVNDNLETLFQGMQTCCGFVLMITGLLVVCYGFANFFKKEGVEAAAPAPAAIPAPVVEEEA